MNKNTIGEIKNVSPRESNTVLGGGWISVADRLPEAYSFVLGALQTPYDRWVEIVGFGTSTFTLPGRGRTVHVTHWMSIPKPPGAV